MNWRGAIIGALVAFLLVIACGSTAQPQAQEANSMQEIDSLDVFFSGTVYHIEVDGHSCVIVNSSNGVGISCDWSPR